MLLQFVAWGTMVGMMIISNGYLKTATGKLAEIHLAEGAAALMIDVCNSYAEPLTEDKLFHWHCLLM